MVTITFVQSDGLRQTIDADLGETLMSQAKQKGVDGIEAECGGSMVCGTCHVQLTEEAFAMLGPVPPMEAEMLEYVIEPTPTSRLSCQIRISEALDGAEVHVPRSQR